MKPDGATMETSEPDQAAAAHRPPQEAATEEGQPAAAAAQKANGKPVAVDPKARLKAGGSKVQPSSTGVAGSGSRPGTASHRAEKDAKPSAGRKAAGSASAAGAAPNRAAGAKNQSRVLDRRPVGPVKTSSLPDAAASNGTKPRGPNGAAKRAPAQAANGAKPKTTAPKSNNSNSTKPAAPAASKTTTTSTRPAAGSLTSRPASAVPKPAAAAKPSITATAKVSRAAAPPPAGRTAAVQPSKNAPAAKKDVSRPPPAARKPVAAAAAELPAARKPVAAAGLPASKKIEASRSANAAKPNSAPKAATATKAAAPKVQPPAKPAPTKKPPAAARLPLASRAPGRTPPASPAGRPAGASKPATPATKRGARPPQTGSPFTKKTSNPPVPEAPPQRTAAPAAEPAAPTEKPESAAVEEVQTRGDGEPEEVAQREEAAPPHPLTPPPQQEQTTVAPSGAPPKEPGSPDQTPAPPAASFAPKAAPLNLNEEEEEEEEEEREGSQLVSVSEMSGTTQPTEESRPGSGGAVGGAAWKAGGVWLSELDSEEVSGSQQGASELSAPGVLEGTESTDELGDGSLKGAMDMEGASAGSPDFEKVPDIPANEDDDSDRVCDMEVGSERTDEPRGPRHDNDVDEEDDEDVEMASEGVTESGLESYGNADEDDFADDERLDNLNRVVQPPPPPLPSAPAAQWDQQNPSDCRWAGPSQSCLPQGPEGEPEAQAWPGGGASASAPEGQDVPHPPQTADPRGPAAAPGPSPSSEASTPEERHQERKLSSPAFEAPPQSSQEVQTEREEEEEEEAEPETLPADEVLGGPSTAPTSNPSSSSVTEDEASDTEGEAQLEASSAICNLTFDPIPPPQRCLSTVEEEAERAPGDEAASPASFIFDSNTTPSTKSPGIFSLEELPLEAIKEPYMEAGRQEAEPAKEAGPERRGSKEPLEETTDVQPQYYAICEKTDDSFPGSSSMPQRRDHSSYPRTFCDIIKPAAAPPRLSCADLPPRSAGQQALSPQLRRLEQHHRQLQELQQRREQQSRPLEEAEQERKRRAEEEERKKKEEAEEEIKRNKEERKEEEELKQMMQWQQEARQEARQEAQPSSKAQAALPSPSSVLCTIYEALESSEEEAEDGEPLEKESPGPEPPPLPDFPERPPPLDLDWGEKVDMVQQLINQTLLLHGDGCSSLLLLPGGSGGTLSPLESSLWPRLLPPLTPPSATVTSVSSFSPEAAGSSSQGEWTVVELETHH